MSDMTGSLNASPKAERRHLFLGRSGPDGEFGDASAFSMRLAAPAPRWSLRIAEDDVKGHGSAGGFKLDIAINRYSQASATDPGPAHTVVTLPLSARLGPDEYMLIAEDGTDALERSIGAALSDVFHTLVDVSHRNIAIEIRGSGVRDVLNTGCPLDLSDRAFPIGMATRTVFAKCEIVLMRGPDIAGAAQFRIECWRSFGRYLHEHLAQSAELLGLAPS